MLTRKGFTLIELLVVIAIISILASILFPVFAQAKEAAKKTMSLSNVKNLGTATQLYAGDYDDTAMPLWAIGDPETTTPDNFGVFRWGWLLMPYVKNMDMYRSPSDNTDLSMPACFGGCRDKKNPFYGYLWGTYGPSYGYNWLTWAPDFQWDPNTSPGLANTSTPMGDSSSRGKPLTSISDPSNTVMLADSTSGLNDTSTQLGMGFYRIEPPQTWTGQIPQTRLTYGFVMPRHNNTANTVFGDSHAKAVHITKLADPALWPFK